MTNPFDALLYIEISGLPLGQLTKQNRDDIPHGLKRGIGRQSGESHLITHYRPNRATTHTYNPQGEITGIDEVADMFILIVDSASVSWADEDEMREDIAQTMSDDLGVPVSIFNNPNITVQARTQAGNNQHLNDNAAAWGETVA